MLIARILKQWWLRVAVWGLAGLAMGWLVSFFVPERYTSEATLLLVPAMVSQDLMPHEAVDVDAVLDAERPSLLSRNMITTIVTDIGLYPHERVRLSIDKIAENFRKSVHIERSRANVIRVAFTYSDSSPGEADGDRARKVTQSLVSRLISENHALRSNMTVQAAQFFQDQVDKIGKSWSALNASVKATPATDPRYELLVLARDQKRKEYESAAQKLGTAETLAELAARGQDLKLEVLDDANLPEQPDTPPYMIWLVGLGCGLAAGLLVSLFRARRTLDMAVPAVPEPA